MMQWLYIHLPQLQLDTLCHESETSVPLVIIDAVDNSVVQCDHAAKAKGIVIGHGLGSAAALCPNLRVISYCANSETSQLEQMAQACYQHMADIAIMPPQGLLLRLTPMLKLYRDAASCWQVIKPCIEQVTAHYSVALAHSAMAAQCLARQQAIDNQDANVSMVMLEHKMLLINQQLAKVALSTTTLANKVIRKLSHIGINRLGDLLNIPLKELAQRFDIEVVNILGQISGQLRTALTFYQPSAQFHYYLDLHFEIQTTIRLSKPMGHVLARLEQYLILRELLASELHLRLILRDKPPQIIHINSAQGEQKQAKLLELGMLKLERLSLNSPVIALELDSILLIEKQTVSGDIFNPSASSSNKLSPPQLISLLQAKLGDGSVQSITHHQEHAPECANRQQMLQLKDNQSTQSPKLPSLLRPSYLLSSPRPWHEPVTIIHGPERIQTHWWLSQPIERDYYIATNSQQQWCWLFKQADGQWFIHGYFG